MASLRTSRFAGTLVWLLGAALLGLVAGPAEAKKKLRTPDPQELTNYLLGPEHAQWLVGPIFHIATEEERRRFLALTTDEAAEEFVEAFWERRGPHRKFPPAGIRHPFEERSLEADRLFTEGVRLGRRTDRGTTYVLYGPPKSTDFEPSPVPGGEPIEIWSYGKDAPEGLDGSHPEAFYYFRKQDGETRFSNPPRRRSRLRPELDIDDGR